MAALKLEGLRKSFGGTEILKGVDLDLPDGEMLVIVGASGCGKSTLLRIVAGLEAPTAGRILIDGRDVTGVDPAARDIAMVFQNYALYPHMSVFDNMAYGLKIRGLSRADIRAKVDEASALLGLDALLGRKPRQLSGGQRQRVAMGRAIVRDPKLFLFDEPLSNLDAKLRVQMRGEIRRLQRRLKVTSLYVTHDQVEAMDAGRPAARHASRRAGAVRHPHGGLRAAGRHLRGGFHRLAGHEPDAGHARARRHGGRGSTASRSRWTAAASPAQRAAPSRWASAPSTWRSTRPAPNGRSSSSSRWGRKR